MGIQHERSRSSVSAQGLGAAFVAPEVKAGNPSSKASDIFSAGKILEEFLNTSSACKANEAIGPKSAVSLLAARHSLPAESLLGSHHAETLMKCCLLCSWPVKVPLSVLSRLPGTCGPGILSSVRACLCVCVCVCACVCVVSVGTCRCASYEGWCLTCATSAPNAPPRAKSANACNPSRII